MNETNQSKPVESLSEFIVELNKKIALINKLGGISDDFPIWFRGEDSQDYELVPNLYRFLEDNQIQYWNNIYQSSAVKQIEDNIDVSFDRKAIIHLANKGIANTRWNRYFLKQHYRVKTRLLDWTENALYALFFSVAGNSKSTNAKVWLLSPHKLNNYSLQKITKEKKNGYLIFPSYDFGEKRELMNEKGELSLRELMRKYCIMDFEAADEAYPLAIYPPHLDSRMAAQQACFTVFGNIVCGFRNLEEKFLEFVLIDASCKEKILKELRLIGISNYSIYPDLDGLGQTINYYHLHDIFNGQQANELNHFFNSIEE